MKNKKVYVDGKYEYDLECQTNKKNEKVYTLCYNANSYWSYPNEIAAKLINTGNCFKFIVNGKLKRSNLLDYSYAFYMRILLTCEAKYSNTSIKKIKFKK